MYKFEIQIYVQAVDNLLNRFLKINISYVKSSKKIYFHGYMLGGVKMGLGLTGKLGYAWVYAWVGAWVDDVLGGMFKYLHHSLQYLKIPW